MGVGTGTDEATKGGVQVRARTIPAPSTISVEAQAFLTNPPNMGEFFPASVDDKAAWRASLDAGNANLSASVAAAAGLFPAEIVTHQVAAIPVYEVIPDGVSAGGSNHAIFYLHGGGYVVGWGIAAAHMALPLATMAKVRAFAVDYRMPPEHPFPTALDDTVEAYRWLLGRFDAKNIVVVGLSAGGGLAASFLLKARDLGLPMPQACILATPEADLTESGDTFETNESIDVVLKHRLTDTIALYANGHDLRDPHLSPVFGDFSKGFPPTMLLSGTRDLFLSNTVILHRALLRAGCEAELHIWEAMPHSGFMGAPEDGEVLMAQAAFVRRKLQID